MHIYSIFIIYHFQTFVKNVAGYDWVTTKEILGLAVSPGMCSLIKINSTLGSITEFVAPWINDSSLCHTNQNVSVATSSLYGGQVLVMRNDCQSHIFDFHESTVTDVEIPWNTEFSNSRKCLTVLGLFNTYLKWTDSQKLDYVLVRLRKNTWAWLKNWIQDAQLLCAVDPENNLILPHQMNALATNKEHKLLFDLENRIFYNCSTNKCSNGENGDFSAADVHISIPSEAQLFEFGNTAYTICHSCNDNGKPLLNGRDIRNSTNAFVKPSPGGLHFKLFAVNISNKDTKVVLGLDKTGSEESEHEDVIVFILFIMLIIGGCIIVPLLVTVYIQRSKLSKIKNSKPGYCNPDAGMHGSQLQRSPTTAINDLKTNVLTVTNDIQDPLTDFSSKSMETVHEEPQERSAALVNPSPRIPTSTSIKSCSDVTQSLSSDDFSPDSSTVKSIGHHLKKWNNLKIPPARPHPETSKIESISTKIPTGPQECMNPRGEKTTSKDHSQPTLGEWPIQFMRRVLRAKRRSKTPAI